MYRQGNRSQGSAAGVDSAYSMVDLALAPFDAKVEPFALKRILMGGVKMSVLHDGLDGSQRSSHWVAAVRGANVGMARGATVIFIDVGDAWVDVPQRALVGDPRIGWEVARGCRWSR
jgi:hypothetical protein